MKMTVATEITDKIGHTVKYHNHVGITGTYPNALLIVTEQATHCTAGHTFKISAVDQLLGHTCDTETLHKPMVLLKVLHIHAHTTESIVAKLIVA